MYHASGLFEGRRIWMKVFVALNRKMKDTGVHLRVKIDLKTDKWNLQLTPQPKPHHSSIKSDVTG